MRRKAKGISTNASENSTRHGQGGRAGGAPRLRLRPKSRGTYFCNSCILVMAVTDSLGSWMSRRASPLSGRVLPSRKTCVCRSFLI